jgi:urease accessory protein
MHAAPRHIDNPGWTARLELEFAQRDARTYLARRQHVGPLVVQRPFFPEPNACHVYLVHPPGGIVGGDDLAIDVRVCDGAHALLTTPAATKFYRCEEREGVQTQSFAVESGALEWLPQETIFYRGARARSTTSVKVTTASKFIGWELPCLGLPASSAGFERGDLRLNFELFVDGEPRLFDRLRIEGESAARKAFWGVAGYDALGTLLAYPARAAMLDAIRELKFDGVELAATVVDDVLVCRALGAQAEPVKHAFVSVWKRLRPMMLERGACVPRIWAT